MTVRDLPLADLASRCRDETLRFLRGEDRDDRFCFEIFKRAIVSHEDAAWAAIVAQYRGIVLAYVGQHTAASILREPDDYWVNRAFQRFWTAVGADRFSQFPDLPALLKYLTLCVHSVLMDEMRARRGGSAISLDDVPETTPSRTNDETRVLGKLAGQQLWSTIERELQDEAEHKVVYFSFVRDLKPAEIAERFPDLFPSVGDVYRVKRNVLDRLRRSRAVREFLSS
jgi:DNA-directed RNA polymerase specialized sigma24 family protein